jgi:hypothetical protein
MTGAYSARGTKKATAINRYEIYLRQLRHAAARLESIEDNQGTFFLATGDSQNYQGDMDALRLTNEYVKQSSAFDGGAR